MSLKNYFVLISLIIQSILFGQNNTVKTIQFDPELIGNHYQSNKKSKTALLIIPGSGPTDRDGNSAMSQTNTLKYLAEGLVQSNYDVVTYDKRVVYLVKNFNGKMEEFPVVDFQHGIDDAKTIINYLKTTLKYKNVVVIGHSEGSLIGMNAANKTASAFVSIAGAGRPIDLVLKEQINKQAPFLNEATEQILDELKKGNKVNEVHPMLQSLFGEKNQPFIMEWIQHDPQKELKTLKIPVLILQGDKDIQTEVKEAEFLKAAKADAQYVVLKNMNHVLKVILEEPEQLKSYNNPDLPLHPELIPTVLQFLKSNQL